MGWRVYRDRFAWGGVPGRGGGNVPTIGIRCMRVLTSVKLVPDLEGPLRVDPSGTVLAEAGLVFRMNAYDACAVEEAVRIREHFGDVTITALSVGPERAEAAVRRALELGADEGVRIPVEDLRGGQAGRVAALIAAYASGARFDLLLFGVMSEDEQASSTGPMVAALLGLPYATTVVRQRISEDLWWVIVEREMEGGAREEVELPLPALLTVQSGINRPRYPSLSNKLRARGQAIGRYEPAARAAGIRCPELVALRPPPSAPSGLLLEGDLEAMADRLVGILRERTTLL